MAQEQLRFRRFGHACVRVEVGDRVLVLDPGEFSDPAAVVGADALLFTHAHADHLAPGVVQAARRARGSLQVWAPRSAAAACGVDEVGLLEPGMTAEVAGVPVRVLGGSHAAVYPGVDPGENVALQFGDLLLHPGDSFTLPDGAVRTLLVPIMAPWSRLSEVVAYLGAVSPRRAVPIHDALLSALGTAAFDRMIAGRAAGTAYERPAPGAWCVE